MNGHCRWGRGGDGGSVTGWRETKHSLRLIAAPGFAFQFWRCAFNLRFFFFVFRCLVVVVSFLPDTFSVCVSILGAFFSWNPFSFVRRPTSWHYSYQYHACENNPGRQWFICYCSSVVRFRKVFDFLWELFSSAVSARAKYSLIHSGFLFRKIFFSHCPSPSAGQILSLKINMENFRLLFSSTAWE